MDNILELKNVSYLYSKGTPFQKIALDNVSVGFERGKITAQLTGKSL